MDQIEIYLKKNTFNIVSTKELNNLRIWNKETHEEIFFVSKYRPLSNISSKNSWPS